MDPTAKRETEGNTFTAIPRNRIPAITSIDIQFTGLSKEVLRIRPYFLFK
jgi:hypothetical protein